MAEMDRRDAADHTPDTPDTPDVPEPAPARDALDAVPNADAQHAPEEIPTEPDAALRRQREDAAGGASVFGERVDLNDTAGTHVGRVVRQNGKYRATDPAGNELDGGPFDSRAEAVGALVLEHQNPSTPDTPETPHAPDASAPEAPASEVDAIRAQAEQARARDEADRAAQADDSVRRGAGGEGGLGDGQLRPATTRERRVEASRRAIMRGNNGQVLLYDEEGRARQEIGRVERQKVGTRRSYIAVRPDGERHPEVHKTQQEAIGALVLWNDADPVPTDAPDVPNAPDAPEAPGVDDVQQMRDAIDELRAAAESSLDPAEAVQLAGAAAAVEDELAKLPDADQPNAPDTPNTPDPADGPDTHLPSRRPCCRRGEVPADPASSRTSSTPCWPRAGRRRAGQGRRRQDLHPGSPRPAACSRSPRARPLHRLQQVGAGRGRGPDAGQRGVPHRALPRLPVGPGRALSERQRRPGRSSSPTRPQAHPGHPPAAGSAGDELTPAEQFMAATRTVDAYAYSADDEIGPQHLPESIPSCPDAVQEAVLAQCRQGVGRRAAARRPAQDDPDHFRKMWALSRPDLTKDGSGLKRGPATILFLDEAQDTPPVLAKVVSDQKMRKVIVGDADQAIYGFTGATDYLSTAPATLSCR
jgi:hypothetical protein